MPGKFRETVAQMRCAFEFLMINRRLQFPLQEGYYGRRFPNIAVALRSTGNTIGRYAVMHQHFFRNQNSALRSGRQA